MEYRACLIFFEDDPTDAADVLLSAPKSNCTGNGLLAADETWDTKKMVRLNAAQAAGQQLCSTIETVHVPGTQPRKVVVVQNYSADTALR